MSKPVTFKQADLTDPAVLRACGLKRKGAHVVTDDGDEEHVHAYTADEKKKLGIAD